MPTDPRCAPEERAAAITAKVTPVVENRPDIQGLYLFGSQLDDTVHAGSDVDLGVLFDHRATLDETVELEVALELALKTPVDLVDMGRAKPFLALDIVRGERIYEGDGEACDRFDLYVLRRAADLAPFERERRRVLMTPSTRRAE